MNTELNRRDMLTLTAKGAMAATLLGGAVELEGCSAEQWIATALADLPTILQIVTSIVGIISAAQGGTVPQGILNVVNAASTQAKSDLQLAQALIMEYDASGDKPAALSKIDVALTDGLNNLQSILTAFHVSDQTLESTIAAALGSAITIVLAIQLLVPPPPAASSARLKAANQKDQSFAMRQAFNMIVSKAYPNAVI